MLPADANGLTQATWHWLVLITELLDHSRFHVRNGIYTVIYTKVTTFLFSQASRILHNKQLAWKNHPVIQDLSISTCVAYFVYGPPHKQVLRLARHPSITPRLTTIASWRISPIWRLQQTERDLLTLHLRENRIDKIRQSLYHMHAHGLNWPPTLGDFRQAMVNYVRWILADGCALMTQMTPLGPIRLLRP